MDAGSPDLVRIQRLDLVARLLTPLLLAAVLDKAAVALKGMI